VFVHLDRFSPPPDEVALGGGDGSRDALPGQRGRDILTDRPGDDEPNVSLVGPDPVVTPNPGTEPMAQVAAASSPEPHDDEWTRLRDALRDDGVEDDLMMSEFGVGASAGALAVPPSDDPLFDFMSGESGHEGGYGAEWSLPEARAGDPDAGDDEPRELTLEDLKKAPPEYRDLPIGDPTGSEDPAPSGSAGEPEVLDELFGEEPDIADVELAADQLAREFAPGDGDVEDPETASLPDGEPARSASREGPRTVRVGEPETMTGPTWEEPTSQVVTAERPGPRVSEGRNLPAAILTAVVLAAALLVSVFVAPWLFTIVAGAVVLLGQFELYTTMQRRGFRPASALGLVIGALMAAGAYFRGEAALMSFIGLGLIASFLWVMASPPKAREGVVANVGTTMLGVLYAPFLASYYVLILMGVESGRSVMLAVLGLTFLYDAAAYFFGSFWGSRALAPTISPKKSWEGLLGATVIVYALAIAFLPAIGPLTLGSAVGLATVVVVFAPLGDLSESMIKRDLGVKDMGSVLPGHGGILDRIDSALFVGIAAFYFLRLVLG
jgi:phosphatidate cytidylyltransferase